MVGCWGCCFFFFFPSIGVALGWITWYQPADCLVVIAQHTAHSTAQVAMMEMSNAQSLFGHLLCAVCLCVRLPIWSEQPDSQGVFPVWLVTSTLLLKTTLPAFLFLSPRLCLSLSFCVYFSSLPLCVSHTHINTHTQIHRLCRIQMVLAAGLISNVP